MAAGAGCARQPVGDGGAWRTYTHLPIHPPLQVLLQDAVVAVWLMESCSGDQHSPLAGVLAQCGEAAGGAQPFPVDPDGECGRLQEAMVAAVRAGAAQHSSYMLDY